MKKHILTAILVFQATGWAAATVQGVLLQVSPKGVSPDAFLFGGLFGLITLATAALAWLVHRRNRVATTVVSAGFALVGLGGVLIGLPIMLMGFGAADSYVLPIGLLAVVAGAAHLAAAWLGFSVSREVSL